MTTIYTGNTTTTGFVVTADNSGDLVLKTGGSGGTTAATFDGTTQQATFNAPVSQPGSFMFRNKIINGNFDIWQRGTSQTSNGYDSADRWFCSNLGSTKTASRQAFTLGQTDVPNNPKYFMRQVVSSVSGAGNLVSMQNRIEGVETLAGQVATISFWAKADASKNIAIEFTQSFGTGGSPSTQVDGIGSQLVALTTSWAKYTITVDIPSVTGKTLGTDGNDSLRLIIWFDGGSDFDSRISSLGQQSGTFDIAQVQVEEGSAATPFEMRPIGLEQNLCERYYQQSESQGDHAFASVGYSQSNSVVYYAKAFRNTMRVAPTVTLTNGGQNGFGATSGLGYQSTAGFRTTRTGTGTVTSGYFIDVWKADAEL